MAITYRFGSFLLDQRAYQLTADGATIPLSPRAIDLLLLFAEQPGRLFGKEEIFQKLWPDVIVTDNALTQVISELRQALGDKPSVPTFIETVARRGYRFIAPVDAAGASQSTTRAVTAQAAELQSAIVTALMAGLRVTLTASAPHAIGVTETPHLDAHRLVSEGSVKLESLDRLAIPEAISDFTRALALDPRYTPAHIGLAHARFWLFQASRARTRPEIHELDAAIAHAERAVEFSPDLAEARAALCFFLASRGRTDDALGEGRLAVAMQPGNWRHHFRLGIAAWGDERLAHLDVVMRAFPALTHAHFAAAMVYIARGDLFRADDVLATGIDEQARSGMSRFPARGLHWLRALIAWRRDDGAKAMSHIEAELASTGHDLFFDEFSMNAWCASGFIALAGGRASDAVTAFRTALGLVPDDAKSWLGLAAALRAAGATTDGADAQTRGESLARELAAHRPAEAALACALVDIQSGRGAHAAEELVAFLHEASPGYACWTLPIEPWMPRVGGDEAFVRVLDRLRERASLTN